MLEKVSKIIADVKANGGSELDCSQIEWALERAFDDCAGLDAANGDTLFANQLESALCGQDVWKVVWAYVDLFARKELEPKGGFLVTNSPEEFERESTLHWLRMLLKDGVFASDALKLIAGQAQPILARGDVEFVKRLGKEISKNHSRSREAWLRRGWLTLALWECTIPQMRVRCSKAVKVLRAARPVQLNYGKFDEWLKADSFAKTVKMVRCRVTRAAP